MKRKFPFFLIFIAISATAIAGYFLLLRDEYHYTGEDFVSDSFPPADIQRLTNPKIIADFQFSDAKQNIRSFSEFAGKNILINFWAKWCVPCVEELPTLNKLVDLIGADNLEVIAISVSSEDISDTKNFFDELGINNLNIYHDKSAYDTLKPLGIPTSILIGKDQKEYIHISGYVNWLDPEILNMINSLP